MSRIRSKDTKPEMLVRRALHAAGLRFRVHAKLPGRPDIVFGPCRLAVFCHGCWWHICPRHFRMPKSNVGFWREKFRRNAERDRRVVRRLRRMGWGVLRFWEHEINCDLAGVVRRIERARSRRLVLLESGPPKAKRRLTSQSPRAIKGKSPGRGRGKRAT